MLHVEFADVMIEVVSEGRSAFSRFACVRNLFALHDKTIPL
jgi:hypothetical protein